MIFLHRITIVKFKEINAIKFKECVIKFKEINILIFSHFEDIMLNNMF